MSKPQTHGLLHSFKGPTKLENERPIVPDDYSRDLFNDMGFVLRAKADTGEDIHLWMFMYRQLKSDHIMDNEVGQTLMVQVKYDAEEKKTMHDTAFVNKGQNIDDYEPVGSLNFAESKDKGVVWSLAGRIFESQPPNWRVMGEHAGVKVDLTFTQRGDAFYHCGEFGNLKNGEGLAGYIVHCHAKGTVTTGEKTLTISNGHGVHERIIMAGKVPARLHYMAGRGSCWLHGWGKSLSFYCLTRDLGRSSTFMLNIEGETLVTQGSENAWMEEADFWLDPKTNQMNPRKWKLRAQTDKGQFEATITAYGRAYYTWIRKGGALLVHQFCADSDAKFTKHDGSVIEEHQVASLEYMRTLYIQPTP